MGLFGRRRKNQPATGAATTATTTSTPPANIDKESLHGRMEHLQAEMERVNKRHEAEMQFLNKRMVSMVAKVQVVPPPQPPPSQQRRAAATKQQIPPHTSQLSNRSQRSNQSYQLDQQQQQQRQQYQPRHNYQLPNQQGRTSTPPVSEIVILTENLETTAESSTSNDEKSRDATSHHSGTSKTKGRKVRKVVRTVRPIDNDAVSASPTVASTTESHASSHKSKDDAPSSSEIEFRPTQAARIPTATAAAATAAAAAAASTKKNIIISHSPPPRNSGGGGGSNVKNLRERLFTDSMGAAASSSSGGARAAATGQYDVVKKDTTRAKWTPPSQPSNTTKQMKEEAKKVPEKVVSTTYGRARASDPPGGRNVTRDPPEASRQWGQPKKQQQQQLQVNTNTEKDDGVVHETTYGRNVTSKNKKCDNSKLKSPSSNKKPITTGRPMPPISNASLLKEIRRQDVKLNKVSTTGDEEQKRVAVKQTNSAKSPPGPEKTTGGATPPNFLDEIQQKNGQLRKTKQQEPTRPKRMTPATAGGSALSSNPPNDLLAGIRAGVKLREVEKSTSEAPRPPQVSHMGTLLAKIQERKQQIRERENEETDW